ncbi:MAG: PQQ-dependent sugar dehydrogenase [Gemmatimonadales bacterium]|nr:PQQ-dependent sugar dehydrogenase [Gemmatimonadales bacterium]
MILHARTLIVAFAALVVPVAAAPPAVAQIPSQAPDSTDVYHSARHDFRVVVVTEDLEFPWSMAWLPTGEMLVVERPGRLRILRDGVLDPDPIEGFPAVYRPRGQGGFMDILPHPDFARNRLLYLSYGKPNADGSEGATAIVRGRLDGNRVVDVQEIFVADAWHGNNNHFSGRLTFDTEGYLYLAVGDRQADPNLLTSHPSQDPSNHGGTLVRLHDDGRVPDDNPFIGHPSARPEVWSYGHRNIQGLATDPRTGTIWSNEHGPRGGDELNRILPGRNYGWPVVTHGVNYDGTVITRDTHLDSMEDPLYLWTPSIGVSGLMIYSGDAFPWWQGNAFLAGMIGERLVRITFADDDVVSEEMLLHQQFGRVRDVRQGPDGFIYLALENREGQPMSIVRLEPVVGEVKPPGR